jgi:hypothetical protein
VTLLRDCLAALGVDAGVAEGVSVHTVHYYRRRDVIDPPDGRTAAARYRLRHLWQVAGARLAGHLGLVTLAEARAAMRDASDEALVAFLAVRVADARGREAMHAASAAAPVAPPDVRPSAAASTSATTGATRALPGRARALAVPRDGAVPALLVPLPGEAICVVPMDHPARHSAEAAHALASALVSALARDHGA